VRNFHAMVIDNVGKMIRGQAIRLEKDRVFERWLAMPDSRTHMLLLTYMAIYYIGEIWVLVGNFESHNVRFPISCTIRRLLSGDV